MDTIRLNKNKTTKFILPLVFDDNVKHTEIITNLVNAYIADLEHPENDNKLTIVYETEKEGTETIKEIPEQWEPDHYRVLAGEYSETSEEYKKKVLNFWEQDENSLLWAILYKEKNNAIRDFWTEHLQEGSTLNDLNEFYPSFRAKDEILINGIPEQTEPEIVEEATE